MFYLVLAILAFAIIYLIRQTVRFRRALDDRNTALAQVTDSEGV